MNTLLLTSLLILLLPFPGFGVELELVGRLVEGAPECIAFSGSHALVGTNEGLWIVDVSDPASPEREAVYLTDYPVTAICVVGSLAYLACESAGLRIFDTSSPTDPVEIGALGTANSTEDVAVEGDYAYLADSPGGLRIIDVTDPEAPVEAGVFEPSQRALAIRARGDYAYVLTRTRFYAVDVSVPENPLAASYVLVPHGAYGGSNKDVCLEGDFAYLAVNASYDMDPYYWWGVVTVDITDPHSLRNVAYTETEIVQAIRVSGSRAYLAHSIFDGYSYQGAVGVLDLTVPEEPRYVPFEKVDFSGQARGLGISNGLVYVAAANAGLRVLDFEQPSGSEIIHTIPTVGDILDVRVDGAYGYLARPDRLDVVDVSDPSGPTVVGTVASDRGASEVFVQAGYVYAATEDVGLKIFDVRDPYAPAERGLQVSIRLSPSVHVLGSDAYVTQKGGGLSGLLRVDVSDPMNPVTNGMGSLSGTAEGVFATEAYAYVADGYEGVSIHEIQTDNGLSRVGGIGTPGKVVDVFVDGPHVYTAQQGTGDTFQIYDVSDLRRPRRIARVSGPSMRFPYELYFQDGMAFVVGRNGLTVLDVTDPALASISASYSHGSMRYKTANGVHAVGDYVYVACTGSGLWILSMLYSVSGHVLDGDGAGVAGVVMNVSGESAAVCTTRADGYFEIAGLTSGEYTLTPTKDHMVFAPAQMNVQIVHSDRARSDFAASLVDYKISGHLLDESSSAIEGAEVCLLGSTPCGNITDSHGRYEITASALGDHIVIAAKDGWVFSPEARHYEELTADWPDQDFTGAWHGLSISGYVRRETGEGINAAIVHLTGDAEATDTTGYDGRYEFDRINRGSYTISVAKPQWVFLPATRTYTDIDHNHRDQSFTGATETVSIGGFITEAPGEPMAGVVVSLTSPDLADSDTTDAEGSYELIVPGASDCTIEPSKSGWVFTPVRREYCELMGDRDLEDFAGTWVGLMVNGYIKSPSGQGLDGVVVRLSNGLERADTTDASGFYEFAGLSEGDYALTPIKDNWVFTPNEIELRPLDRDRPGEDFSADLESARVNVIGGEDGYVDPGAGGAIISVLTDASGDAALRVLTLRGEPVWSSRASVIACEVSTVIWDCRNVDGHLVAPGIYVLQVEGAGLNVVKKFAIVR